MLLLLEFELVSKQVGDEFTKELRGLVALGTKGFPLGQLLVLLVLLP